MAVKQQSKTQKLIKWHGKLGDKKIGQNDTKPITYVSGVPTRDLTLLEFEQLEEATRALVVSSGLYEATGEAVGAFKKELRPDTQATATASSSGVQDSPGGKA